MTPQEIGMRIAYGAAIASIPIATMRADKLRYGMGTTLLALVGYSFSGGWFATAIAGIVVLGFQFYLRVVAMRKLRWVVGTCLTLGAFLTHRATFLPEYIRTWDESFKSKIFVAAMGVALSMIVTCIEMKVVRLKETLKKDVAEVAGAIGEKIKEHIPGK